MVGSRVNDILVFMSVVESGSFAAGGRAFGLSRSTAGKAVARLEDSYGTRLLNRTTRALDLTEEGRLLYESGQAIRAALEAAEADLAGAAGAPRGTLRVTAPDAVGRRLLLRPLYRFLSRWPEVQVEMSFSDRVDNIIGKGFDLAIRIGADLPDGSFISRTLMTDRPLLCAAPGYFDMRERPRTAEQLSCHDLLQFAEPGNRQAWDLQDWDGAWRRAPGRVRLRFDSAEALRAAMLAGMGIALLPEILVGPDIAAGRAEEVLPGMARPSVPIVAIYPHKRLLEPRVRQFLDLLIEELPHGPRDQLGD